ncbi:hypothetical protein STW0522ENT62_17710 [Enterobacter kobei]|nr:hypothetical protein STW0522ENT62_17710 [Enterobacter kobei]
MNFLIEVFAAILYILVIFPMYIVCSIIFMVLCIITLPLKIPVINRWVRNYLKRKK